MKQYVDNINNIVEYHRFILLSSEYYQVNNEELAALYIDLSMKYEEDNYVECGFKAATDARKNMIDKIKAGSLSKKDIHILEPIFSYGDLNIHTLVKPKKRFIFF